ncbi:peptidase S8/S53 domain-containing protein [Lactarius hengduanensis]|nr:peptidase S8/S53 domain-containing protein [Lactarius hengduanensis]
MKPLNSNWETLGCPPATTIDLYIALNPPPGERVDSMHYTRYGAHLSKEQAAELVRPHPDTLELVTSWLASSRRSALLDLNDTRRRVAHAMALPEVLYAHIQAVAPTTYFASTRTLRQTPRRRSVEAAVASAAQAMSRRRKLHWLYKTFAYIPTAADRNTLGVFGYQKEYLSETDLNKYMTNFRSDVQPPGLATFAVELVTGGIGEWSDSGEPLPGDMYLESLEYLLRKTDIPQTISISYGATEWHVPQEYARVLCTLFAQLGARGVSVLFPSGDEGVGKDCEDDSGNFLFVPEFPASCPYLTAVGGTGGHDPEVAAPLSGGGFSDHFPRPVYQDVASPCPHSSLAKAPNMLASTIVAVVASLTSPPKLSDSQSSSETMVLLWMARAARLPHSQLTINAQTVAGIISLLNDYLITNGGPPLGFLNIRLYDDGFAGLNDITSGSNPGCGTDGFSAAPGWDPVTGLGTPDFEKLQNIFMTPLGGGAGQGN